jgi:hypothetical protein
VTTPSGGRLRDDKFEHKAKQVIQADLFKDRIGALADPDLARRYNEFADCIALGRYVPAHFYRRGIGVTPDDLLDQDGIKHVHLDGGGGDVLLFVVEYHDAIVFLEINSHKHFEDEPPGSVLRSLHANCLRREDKSARERLEEWVSERKRIVREGLRRRPKDPERDESAPHAKDE